MGSEMKIWECLFPLLPQFRWTLELKKRCMLPFTYQECVFGSSEIVYCLAGFLQYLSSGSNSLKLTVSWSLSQIESDGNPIAIQFSITHRISGSQSSEGICLPSHPRNLALASDSTSLRSGYLALRLMRNLDSSRAPAPSLKRRKRRKVKGRAES